MSKNTLLSNLINYISANSSGNVVVAAPTSGLALDVNGTGRFTGQLTLGSTITNGTFTYTLPSATGTLALTSALGSYLPLSGGTLTGALNGTSATFSTTIADYAMSVSNVLDSSQGLLVRATDNDGNLYLLRLQSSNGATSQTWVDRFTVAKNGAATFSSSVTAGDIFSTDGTRINFFGVSTNSNCGFIGTTTNHDLRFLTNNTTKLTIQAGGNVGIGTTAPSSLLHLYTSTARNIPTLGNAGGHQIIQTGGVIATCIGVNANGNYWIQPQHINPGDSTVYSILLAPSGGNVGIGTTSPSRLLEVASGGDTGYIRVTGNRGNANEVHVGNIEFYNSNTSRLVGEVKGLTGTGGTQSNSGQLAFYTNNNGTYSERVRIRSNGSVGIGTAGEDSVTFEVKAASTSNLNYAVLFQDSNAADLFYVRADGLISTGLRTQSPYNTTTGAAANAVVASDGILARSTSSLKYKKNVLNYTKGLSEVMQLRPVSYQGKNKMDEGKTFAGLIAEEVHDLGLTEFVQYAEDGTPDALAYQNMVSLLIKGIQELKAELDTLKNK